jgi:hypothetical protein
VCEAELTWADVVLVSGMHVQKAEMKELARRARACGKTSECLGIELDVVVTTRISRTSRQLRTDQRRLSGSGEIDNLVLAKAFRTKLIELQVPQDCHENPTRPLPVQVPESFGNPPFDLTFPRSEPIR